MKHIDFEHYLVGGAVRDELLGLAIKDRDWLVVGQTIESMLARGYDAVGKTFPVFLHPQSKEEYALARKEVKVGKGYTGFDCICDPSITLEQDLLRRDLTINAIAKSPDGTLHDPYNGQADINNKILRHVSDAFTEDPLRVLRVARFYARFAHLGFQIADETLQLMQQITQAGELQSLSAERIWQETEKALLTDSPQAYFSALRDCGALAALFPEINNLFGVPQTPKHHPEIDTGVHTLMVLEQACRLSQPLKREQQLAVRYSALTHDLGKALTEKTLWPKHHAHEIKGLKPLKKLNTRLKAPKAFAKLAERVCEFHLHSHRAFELKPRTVLKLLKSLDSFRQPEALKLFLLSCEADAKGRLGFEQKAYPQAAYLNDCHHACQQVSAKSLTKETLAQGGQAIGEAIDLLRLKAIKEIKKHHEAAK